MKGNFASKPIELNINLFQAAILLLFRQETLKYTEIRERLGLPDEDMARNLHSLSRQVQGPAQGTREQEH